MTWERLQPRTPFGTTQYSRSNRWAPHRKGSSKSWFLLGAVTQHSLLGEVTTFVTWCSNTTFVTWCSNTTFVTWCSNTFVTWCSNTTFPVNAQMTLTTFIYATLRGKLVTKNGSLFPLHIHSFVTPCKDWCHFYWKADLHLLCVISGFRREADETWDMLCSGLLLHSV